MTKQIFKNRWFVWAIVVIVITAFSVWGIIEYSNIKAEKESIDSGTTLLQSPMSKQNKQGPLAISCEAFADKENPDISELSNYPKLYSGVQWKEISKDDIGVMWLGGEENLTYRKLPGYDSKWITIAEGKQWWSGHVNDEQWEKIREYFYGELKRAGWKWKVFVHGFELTGTAAGGPSGNTDGYLKIQNGYLRTIIVDESVADFNIFVSDIASLKDIIPEYLPAVYLGAFHVDVTLEIQKLKNLPVDYGAWLYNEIVLESPIAPGSPAEKAGLKSGDIILSIKGQRIDKEHLLRNLIAERCPGEKVLLRVLSNGKERDVSVILGLY